MAVVKVLARLKVLSHHQVLLGVRAERLDRHGPVRGALAILVGVGDANLPADQTPAHPLGLGVTTPGFIRLLLVPASSPCFERNGGDPEAWLAEFKRGKAGARGPRRASHGG